MIKKVWQKGQLKLLLKFTHSFSCKLNLMAFFAFWCTEGTGDVVLRFYNLFCVHNNIQLRCEPSEGVSILRFFLIFLLITSVSDPHWFQKGSRSNILGHCISRPPQMTSKLQEKASALKREHRFKTWNSLTFFLPSLDPDPADQNQFPDPKHWATYTLMLRYSIF